MTTSLQTVKATDRKSRKHAARKRGRKSPGYKLSAKDRRERSKIRWASF